MKTISYPLRIPGPLMRLAALRSEEQRIDRSTALRQLMYLGAEDYITQLVGQGHISIGKAAELLNVSVYDIYRIAAKHGIPLGATSEQQKKSMQTARKLML